MWAVMCEYGLVSGLRAVRAEVRTSAGRRSVKGMSAGTSISAVQSQDCAAACTSVVTALCPLVASPTAQQVAWAGTAGALLLVHKEQA